MSARARRGARKRTKRVVTTEDWEPLTQIGNLVKDGVITSIDEIFNKNYKIQETRIVDLLLPNLDEKVLVVGRVQRQTDAGRKTLFTATAAVGNHNGIIGVASGKSTGMGTAIRTAIENAKLAIVPVKRGCGSWECNCTNNPHSVPYRTTGKVGSVKVVLLPGPMGLGLVVGEAAKAVLRLAGVKDVWSKTTGDTRTTANYCKATFEALKLTYKVLSPSEWSE